MARIKFLINRRYFRRVLVLLGILGYPLLGAPALAANSAVIFMYHRFGEDTYPSTSISIPQFEAHIAELKQGGYHVMALPDIVSALKEGKSLPDRAIGISIDDAYLSVVTQAWPRLKAAGFPFTVFVATDAVDRKIKGYMTWQQVNELKDAGVTIGSQTASHLHMAAASRATNTRDLEKSNGRFIAEIGAAPKLIAYPYGEAGLDVMTLSRETGFVAGFGQHSGVANDHSEIFYLPRFALNERYGDISRFRLAANAVALPMTDITPVDPLITAGDENPPAIGFTLMGGAAGALGGAKNLACFVSHEGKATVTRLGGEEGGDTRFEVRMTKPMPKGRTRLNCTMPTREGRWGWFGRQFVVTK